jgi:hypothetical protein
MDLAIAVLGNRVPARRFIQNVWRDARRIPDSGNSVFGAESNRATAAANARVAN